MGLCKGLTSLWVIKMNYSFTDGYISYENEMELPFIAPHKINAGVTLEKNQWSLSPSLQWVNQINSGYMSSADSSKREHINGYTTADVFGTYKFTKDVVASMRISNLTDRRYYLARDSYGSAYITPQLGRVVILGLRVEF